MGCKHSTTIRVQPAGAPTLNKEHSGAKLGREGTTQTHTLGQKNISRESTLEYDLDSEGNKVPKKRSRNGGRRSANKSRRSNKFGSGLSIDDERSLDGDRGFSATSKASADSGLGLGGDEKLLANIITEYSNENDVKKVEESFVERELDLNITGTQLATRHSAKDRARQEESSILQALREEGLIHKSTNESSGGMSFEIVQKDAAESGRLPSLPTKHLQKLERRRKKKRTLTEEEIKEKLERAERRRKKREAERLNRIKDMEKSDALAAQENFEHYKKEKEVQQSHKMDAAADNREKRMQEIREKIQEKERRAEEVRRRKQKVLEQGLHSRGIIDNSQEFPPGQDNPGFQAD